MNVVPEEKYCWSLPSEPVSGRSKEERERTRDAASSYFDEIYREATIVAPSVTVKFSRLGFNDYEHSLKLKAYDNVTHLGNIRVSCEFI